jgi:hypothetical protein
MKIATRFVLATAVLAASAATANAQVLDRVTFKTNFAFVAGNTTLPAGNYIVAPLDDDPSVLQLSNGKVSVLLETEPDRPAATPSKLEVKFNKYGNTYVMHEILDPSAQRGAVILPLRAEKRHQKAEGPSTRHAVPASKVSAK